MRILKFGGSSVATPERVEGVCRIVAEAAAAGPVAVVVSALGGVTDALLGASAAAARGDEAWRETLGALAERHRSAASSLAPPDRHAGLATRLDRAFGDLGDLLHGVALLREASPRTLDRVASYGERLSAALVAAALTRSGLPAEECDARALIVTGREFGAARVDFAASYERIRAHFARVAGGPLQVVTGFIGATPEGETTTLGRGGSDYTASLVGAALAAEAVELWTDVDGVLTADPRAVAAASPIPRMSYLELAELSHFGAKVVFPPSVHPTRAAGVPLLIKNTFNPTFPGTRVEAAGAPVDPRRPVAGISSIPQVALLRLEGDGMVGVPGIAARLFGALAREGISVVLISQASSEHSICFAVEPAAVAAARASIEREFALERAAELIDELVVEPEMAVVAAVGSGMREQAGIAGRLFRTLGDHGISVRALAQGSSERNLSLVVKAAEQRQAVAKLHEAFFFPGRRTVDVALAGVGRVGSELLAQWAARAAALERERGVVLRLVAVAGRERWLREPEGIDPAVAVGALKEKGIQVGGGGTTVEALADRLAGTRRPAAVFVDATASGETGAAYERLLGAGVAVVTANKLRLAGPMEGWRALARAGSPELPGRLYFEATVGAGLPVVRPLADLVATGDRLVRVEGVLSGTLAFLVHRLAAGESFSAALAAARRLGYTEPDPREDLAGRDVARKLLILARVAEIEIEPEAVEVEPLLGDSPPRPPGQTAEGGWEALSLPEFWERLPEVDERFGRRAGAAAATGRRLRVLASLDLAGPAPVARVGLAEVGPEHPAFALSGTDNLVAFTTARYSASPLVVAGPGAGPEVTAAAVFADLLRAADEAAGGVGTGGGA